MFWVIMPKLQQHNQLCVRVCVCVCVCVCVDIAKTFFKIIIIVLRHAQQMCSTRLEGVV